MLRDSNGIYVMCVKVVVVLTLAVSGNVIIDRFDKENDKEFTGLAYGSWTVRSPRECAAHCSRDPGCYACSTFANSDGSMQCSFFTCYESVHTTVRTGSTIYMREGIVYIIM